MVLRAGRVEQVGAPLDLYHRPDNLFVAGFLGAPPMNFLRGEIRQWHAGQAVVALAGGAQLMVCLKERMAPGAPVTLGMRPEHIAADTADGIPATVFAVERLGEGSYLYATVAGSGEQAVVRADPDATWEVGQHLALGAPLARIHVFGENGRRCAP
nr:TOBE domain-containing protein [Massilia atriviolacea]